MLWELGQVQGSPSGTVPLHLALALAAGMHGGGSWVKCRGVPVGWLPLHLALALAAGLHEALLRWLGLSVGWSQVRPSPALRPGSRGRALLWPTILCTLQKLIQLILPKAEHNCIIYGSLLTWLVLLAL